VLREWKGIIIFWIILFLLTLLGFMFSSHLNYIIAFGFLMVSYLIVLNIMIKIILWEIEHDTKG